MYALRRDQPFEAKRVASRPPMPPLPYRPTSTSSMPPELPGSPLPIPTQTLIGQELTVRRPSPYALGPGSLSPHSRYSSPVSPPQTRSLSQDSPYSSIGSPVSPPQTSSSRTSYSSPDPPRVHINIGIDFGTTYSGVSWAISGTSETSINTVINWPNGEFTKVPTEISYNKGTIQWGYSIAPDAERLSWFKLLLAEEDLPEEIRNSKQLKSTRKLLQKWDKDAVEVTANYLQKLWEWALASIRKAWPSGIDRTPFRIVLSVPANWPKTAIEKMRSAATQAGMLAYRPGGHETSLEFVGEPEAAALAAFYEDSFRYDVQVGDIIIICDAGGGTVDIVTYEVNKVAPSITLGEHIDGDMGLCGSIFLDENFIKFMENMLGEDKFMKLPKLIQQDMMYAWEHKIKRQFHKDTIELAPRIPHEIAKSIKSPLKMWKKGKGGKQLTGDTFHFSAADIRSIFDPVMTDILKLIHKQKNETLGKRHKKPKAILLVGGLGGNQYLYQRLYEEFLIGDGITVIQQRGPNTWPMICRGAAMKGMTFDDVQDLPIPVVTSYISKAHYGMMFKEHWDDLKHSDADRRETCAANGTDLAWDQMHWYIKKGDDVSQGAPVEMTWAFEQPESRTQRNFSFTIYECEAEIAPTRRTAEVQEKATIYFEAGRDNVSFRDIAGGLRVRVVRFSVKVTMLGLGRLQFATYVDGKSVVERDLTVKLGGASCGK